VFDGTLFTHLFIYTTGWLHAKHVKSFEEANTHTHTHTDIYIHVRMYKYVYVYVYVYPENVDLSVLTHIAHRLIKLSHRRAPVLFASHF
jgi:galactose-1-phosphate uridylyltransferase